MNVPWGWIKQRPHFIAEYLSENYDLSIFYKASFMAKKRDLVTKNATHLKLKSYFLIPFNRIPIVNKFNFFDFINRALIKLQIRQSFSRNVVWISSWSVYFQIKYCINNDTIVIFDCMDDELEFPKIKNDKILYRLAKQNEEELINRSNLVICSSDYLKQKLKSRYSIFKKIFVINNATNSFKIEKFSITSSVNEQYSALKNVFLYVGTISSWFDFDSVILMLDKNESANFVLVGPSDVYIPIHPRLHYFGSVERDSLPFFIDKSIALTMPFLLNELIRSVDPVKIYEYIGSNKPIIAINYTEMEKFSDFCYLYDDSIGFSDIVSKILRGEISYNMNSEKSSNFVLENTWEKRGLQIVGLINQVIQSGKGE